MPLLIVIGLLVVIRIASKPKPKRISYSKPTPLPVYDPIKERRERERQEERKRKAMERAKKEAEKQRKAYEQKQKQEEEKRAAQDKVNWLSAMIEKYSALSEQIETELENNPTLTSYKTIQLQKQLLQTEEKIRKLSEQRDKAYWTANKPG